MGQTSETWGDASLWEGHNTLEQGVSRCQPRWTGWFDGQGPPDSWVPFRALPPCDLGRVTAPRQPQTCFPVPFALQPEKGACGSPRGAPRPGGVIAGIQTTVVYWPAKLRDSGRAVIFRLQFWDCGEAALRKFDHILPVSQTGQGLDQASCPRGRPGLGAATWAQPAPQRASRLHLRGLNHLPQP